MPENVLQHRISNLLHSAGLLAAMVGVLAGVGWLLAGGTGAWLAVAAAAAFAGLAPQISAARLLRAQGARPLHPAEVPGLFQAMDVLSARAGLERPPRLFVTPLPVPQAMALEGAEGAAIAISPALLRLTPREVIAVLAHELAHLQHHDLRLLRLVGTIQRLTGSMSTFGLVLTLLNLPLVLLGVEHLPWLGVAALLVAPQVVGLLSLALSRSREHDADAGAVALTGDPLALASGLAKIEAAAQGPWWAQMFRVDLPDAARSHPRTEERVARLRSMAQLTRSGPTGRAHGPVLR